MNESTASRRRPSASAVGILLLHVLLHLLSWASLATVAAMAYGMVLDDAAFMLPFPIVLSVPALGLVAMSGIELVTGDSVGTVRRLRDRIRRVPAEQS